MTSLSKAKKSSRDIPDKEFFLFPKPMPATNRELTLLGVAFEDPRQGTLGRHAPQGKVDHQTVSAPTLNEAEDTFAGAPLDNEPALLQEQVKKEKQKSTPYWVGPWPKDIQQDIYPSEALTATGVKAVLNNIKDASARSKVLDAICLGLKASKEMLETTKIPQFRRWSMEDPYQKVVTLLNDKRYRESLINLFELQPKSTDLKVLFIATNIVACGPGVSHSIDRQTEQEASAEGKDPTGHVPISGGAKLHHLNKSAIKGEYKDDIILCMSYRKIRYECNKPYLPNLLQRILPGFAKTQRQQVYDDLPKIPLLRDDGSGIEDIFFFDDFETQGTHAPFMSSEERPEIIPSTSMFGANVSFGSVNDGRKSAYPEGFFGPDLVC